MQVSKWGNSLAVRLPSELVRTLGFKEGDKIELVAAERGLAVRREPSAEEVLERLRSLRGRLPASQRLTRNDANAR
ncbi:AbrB/MazE/SpoVT family DNA-binding domain-containing protein [Paracoccus sp. S-4012]|uniref:AbrB/MazE/SpoVT family DNA-binding domain-containing protein n=1 Tax=Paracoccus sp. S-4012 TaxID=2665648 RepID=UPI0012B0FABE|nr:AbrB/MazE/SpoVT family DNA-binding domain-containing protein [Paracoccus sp. S-4012]MRX49469.1 AbrB/MazE/SpoVT family DNA-binding domain-containing protein [Paracoccus sp. S-4012]